MEVDPPTRLLEDKKEKDKDPSDKANRAVTSEEIKKSKVKQDFSGELDVRLPQLKCLALEVCVLFLPACLSFGF